MSEKKTPPLLGTPVPGRLCWLCAHVRYYNASPDYSEYTPGEALEFHCGRDYWSYDPYGDTLDEFRAKVTTAERCADYERREDQG